MQILFEFKLGLISLYSNLFIQYATFIQLDFNKIYLFNTQFISKLTLFEFIYLIRNFYSNSRWV